ncbi:Lrp/AsnC family transcriptional regulator [Ornithinimicrobium faecis]|uniref:Lrp/AsnC family transcriptional regulator n=1 Tax=Ornithinimicrobium faecis TaxID=2934158 RepID=A0ABY4YTN0_9MICO|nr:MULTISPECIES: Lrp/AsnC family transcriptional regulator [unclassified Ornithinimicrobium]USQ79610.1 Lrp/AsnC family transcriptional regulator [Ornithinimicrobium sp. HY1793]
MAKKIQPDTGPVLDHIDQQLVALLEQDGRTPNATLAREVGVAESTCLVRVRLLRERGVIRGIHADIDPAMVGRPVQAMIAVRFGGHRRTHFEDFREQVPKLPGVIGAFHVSGATDYFVHVACESADALRDFVLDHLTNRPGVLHAETALIFDTLKGESSLGNLDEPTPGADPQE